MAILGKTYADMESTPRDVSWRAIRSLRANPPGKGGGSRQATFTTALEQAEQLFTAAAGIDPAARPLALFYGLSQAGRALGAARAGNPWTFRGHGIAEARSHNTSATTVADFHLAPHASGNGAFNVITRALNSSTLPGPTRIGDLWTLIPDAWRFPLPTAGPHRLLDLDLSRSQSGTVNATISGIPASLAVAPIAGQPAGAPRSDWCDEEQRVRNFLSAYPSLTGYRFAVTGGQPIGLQVHAGRSASVSVHWPPSGARPITAERRRRKVAVEYAGHTNIYPALDGTKKPIHPLAVWWAVLFGLSTLARYEPEAWGRAIDVNTSAEAVAIEHILNAALDSLPELLYRALTSDV